MAHRNDYNNLMTTLSFNPEENMINASKIDASSARKVL